MKQEGLLRQLNSYEKDTIELHENTYYRQKMTLWMPGGDLELEFKKFCTEIRSLILRSEEGKGKNGIYKTTKKTAKKI